MQTDAFGNYCFEIASHVSARTIIKENLKLRKTGSIPLEISNKEVTFEEANLLTIKLNDLRHTCQFNCVSGSVKVGICILKL